MLAATGLCAQAQTAASPPDHFSPKGKAPSTFTVEAQELQRKILPFADKQDFDEAKRGLIAVPASKVIKNAEGGVVWDIGRWDFLLQGKDFNSIHPSLQRQAILNMNYGLYEVVPGKIYQVRGFDLSNISFIKGDTGWIVIDPLTSAETARAGLDLINEKVVVYDGAFGTYVQTLGLGPDDFGSEALEGCNELLVITRPDVITGMHEAFFNAGVDVVDR